MPKLLYASIFCLSIILLSTSFLAPAHALVRRRGGRLNLTNDSNRSHCISVHGVGAASLSPSSSTPWWVSRLNLALERAPLSYICSFIVIDISSCLCILAYLQWQMVQVSPEFSVAYGISRALRFQRLALDVTGAKFLTLMVPAIKNVKVELIFEAIQRRKNGILGGTLHETKLSNDNNNFNSILERTTSKATRLSSEYGLALMTSKNLIGPINHFLLYTFLKSGFDLSKWKWLTSVGDAGAIVGRMAYASWLSTILFPFVVMSAAYCAPLFCRKS